MRIVWDERKRLANLDAAFGGNAEVLAVIFATLGAEGVSIISARPASRKERELLE
jgi:uncharacterized protein